MLLAALSFAIRRIWQTIYKEVKDSGSLPLNFVLFYSINTLYCIKKCVFCAIQSIFIEQCNSSAILCDYRQMNTFCIIRL